MNISYLWGLRAHLQGFNGVRSHRVTRGNPVSHRNNEFLQQEPGDWCGPEGREGFQAPTDVNLSETVFRLWFLLFMLPVPLLLSLSHGIPVVLGSAGRVSALLLIILNQGGCPLLLSCGLCLCGKHTKWRRMKHVCNLFKDSSLRTGCPAEKHFRKRNSLVRIIQRRRGENRWEGLKGSHDDCYI